MKKIIAVFDGLNYSESTKNYTIELAKKTDTQPVGVFLEAPSYTEYKLYETIAKEGASGNEGARFKAANKSIRKAAAESFEKSCRQAGIDCSTHHDSDMAIDQLKLESVYADLIIIDSKETFAQENEKPPTHFIKSLLGKVQCPVLLVPNEYRPFSKVILLYDGEPSSVHAIKMFSYLLPSFQYLDTEVVSVNTSMASLHLPHNGLMKELMKRHFPNAKFTVLEGWAEDEIIGHLKGQLENVLVVLGAYKRGAASRWYRESMADVLMKEVKLPLFIAHNK